MENNSVHLDKPAETATDTSLLPCPFCKGEMLRNTVGLCHVSNDCWLSNVQLRPYEYDLWNRRAGISQPSTVCGQINIVDGNRIPCPTMRRGGEKLCPDCNPRAGELVVGETKPQKDTGGPAFPWGEHGSHLGGMSIRDAFAKEVVAAFISNCPEREKVIDMKQLAISAYEVADAMLKARAA